MERNTIDIFRRRDAFRRDGVPLKRGIILHGPPGTGKTLIGKIIAGLRIATFVYITAGDVDSPEAVRKTFEMARKLAPSIVLMEDIDLDADERSGHCSDAVLGEVLGQLDGFENNDGVIFIARTNDLAAVEPALSERPSRFDVVLQVGCPSEPARRAILAANLPADTADDRLLDEAAAATEGMPATWRVWPGRRPRISRLQWAKLPGNAIDQWVSREGDNRSQWAGKLQHHGILTHGRFELWPHIPSSVISHCGSPPTRKIGLRNRWHIFCTTAPLPSVRYWLSFDISEFPLCLRPSVFAPKRVDQAAPYRI
ncbi:MAG TPA: ATP-binding protein [Pirellulales bacterium]|nr:ATP-binding protein [Pirellulales bacterium]